MGQRWGVAWEKGCLGQACFNLHYGQLAAVGSSFSLLVPRSTLSNQTMRICNVRYSQRPKPVCQVNRSNTMHCCVLLCVFLLCLALHCEHSEIILSFIQAGIFGRGRCSTFFCSCFSLTWNSLLLIWSSQRTMRPV